MEVQVETKSFTDSRVPSPPDSVTAGVAMEISHGHRVTSREDPYVHKANEFADNFAEASLPNNHVVDWLPFCQ